LASPFQNPSFASLSFALAFALAFSFSFVHHLTRQWKRGRRRRRRRRRRQFNAVDEKLPRDKRAGGVDSFVCPRHPTPALKRAKKVGQEER
jgi:hypothetical protein